MRFGVQPTCAPIIALIEAFERRARHNLCKGAGDLLGGRTPVLDQGFEPFYDGVIGYV